MGEGVEAAVDVEGVVEGAGVDRVLQAVEGRSDAVSELDCACADLGCIMARCLLDSCWRTVRDNE